MKNGSTLTWQEIAAQERAETGELTRRTCSDDCTIGWKGECHGFLEFTIYTYIGGWIVVKVKLFSGKDILLISLESQPYELRSSYSLPGALNSYDDLDHFLTRATP